VPRYRAAAGGGFLVHVRGDDRGIGKVVERAGDRVSVEYFYSIAAQERTTVSASSVLAVVLSKQSRCYVYNTDAETWEIGRVGERDGREYEVNFPDQRSEWIPEAAIFVRSARNAADPTDTLVLKGHETAFFHASRQRLRRALLAQRAASHGFTALTSAKIELFPHQVEAIRRVLEDPIERYLLADEVGLGKTVEAGVLIRQYLLDEPNGVVLVIVPALLKTQWLEELRTRMSILEGNRLLVRSVDELDATANVDVGLLVVDEAHAMVGEFRPHGDPSPTYERVRGLALRARRVLLLSATPASSNERQFLSMLHLLDPRIHSLSDLPLFEERVRLRQEVGRLLLTMREDSQPFALKLGVERLRGLFPNDKQLLAHADALLGILESEVLDPEGTSESVRGIRTHISETYRLHRRMIRSRRSAHPEAIVARSRSVVQLLYCNSGAQDDLNSLLEEWRVLASSIVSDAPPNGNSRLGLTQIFLAMIQAADADPETLVRIANARIGEKGDLNDIAGTFGRPTAQAIEATPSFQGETEVVRALIVAAYACGRARDRVRVLLDLLKKERDSAGRRPVSKTVVFCSLTQTARGLGELLAGRFGARCVAVHVVDSKSEFTEAEVARFRDDRDCMVLICDRSGEEGRNFQYAENLIHYDLPWHANRIEQRTGRLDRIGRTKDLRTYILLGSHDVDALQFSWYSFLADGLGVFKSSIASLQFYVDSKLPHVFAAAFDLGSRGVRSLTATVEGELEAEREKIAEDDAIDSIDTRDGQAQRFQASLDLVDARHEEFRGAVEGWMCEALQFRKDRDEGVQGVVRYRADKDTLVPRSDVNGRFGPFLNRPGTYDRGLAAANPELALYRPGEALIDALSDYVDWDDRGKAFAIWRFDPSWDDSVGGEWVGFRFDAIIEADTQAAKKEAATRLGRSYSSFRALDRKGDSLLRPRLVSVFIDSGFREVTNLRLLELLRRPFSKDSDTNLIKDRLPLLERLIDRNLWETTCRGARDAAVQLIRNRPDVRAEREAAMVACKQRLAADLNRLRLRAEHIRSQEGALATLQEATVEEEIGAAFSAGLQSSHIRIDSVGLIVISGRRLQPDARALQ